MATPVEIEAALNTDYSVDVGSSNVIDITNSMIMDATYDQHYVVSRAPLVGKAMWVRTTSAGAAGAQADEITAALLNPTSDPSLG